MVIDQTTETFFQGFSTKINKQPYRLLGQAQICQKLLRMCSVQPINGFDFDQQSILNNKVNPESASKFQAFKLNIDRLLTLHTITLLSELCRQNHFIDAFEKARP